MRRGPLNQFLELFRGCILRADPHVGSHRGMARRNCIFDAKHSSMVAFTFDSHLKLCEIDAQACGLRGNDRGAACRERRSEEPAGIGSRASTSQGRRHVRLNLLAGRPGHAAFQPALERRSRRRVLGARLLRMRPKRLTQAIPCTCNRRHCHNVLLGYRNASPSCNSVARLFPPRRPSIIGISRLGMRDPRLALGSNATESVFSSPSGGAWSPPRPGSSPHISTRRPSP
jgi:hypothetical protein